MSKVISNRLEINKKYWKQKIENIKQKIENINQKIENSLDMFNGRIKTEERISELGNRMEITESEQQR